MSAKKLLIVILISIWALPTDAQSWDLLYTSPIDNIRSMIEYNGDLYVGGSYNSDLETFVAKWTGTAWEGIGTGWVSSGLSSVGVYDMEIFGTDLIIAGNFDATIAQGIIKWTGTTLASLDGKSLSPSYDLLVFDSDLLVCGAFITSIDAAQNRGIAKWDGAAWSGFNQGVNDIVYTVAEYNNELYIGGDFDQTFGGSSIGPLAKWDGINTQWVGVSGLVPIGKAVYRMVFFDDRHYHIMFTETGGSPLGGYFVYESNASLDGSSQMTGLSSTFFSELSVIDSKLYIGGSEVDVYDGVMVTPTPDLAFNSNTWTVEQIGGKVLSAKSMFIYQLQDPSPEFSADITSACTDQLLTFTDESSGTNQATSWNWTFTGGTPSSSTDQNPVVSYTAAGTYDATLSVTSSDGTSELTKTNYISVSDAFAVDAGAPLTITYEDIYTLPAGSPTGGTWSSDFLINSDTEFSSVLSSTGQFDVTYFVTQGNCTVTDILKITVNKADWIIDFPSITSDLPYDPSREIDLAYYGNVVYEVTQGNATLIVSGNTIKLSDIEAGTITVSGTRTGDDNHKETVAETTFTVTKADQTITFSNFINEYVYGEDFDIADMASSDSELPITYSIVSGPATVTDLGNGVMLVEVTGVGLVTVKAEQVGNTNYNAATSVDKTFNAVKAPQSILHNIPSEIGFNLNSYDLSGVRFTAGTTVAFIISSGPGTITGTNMDQYSFTSTGMVTLSASASGNDFYESADPTEINFTVVKGDQELSFSGLDSTDPLTVSYQDTPFELAAEATSGLGIQFTITGGLGTGTISGKLLTVTKVGSIIILASQPGNSNWNKAIDVQQSIQINKADQTISYTSISDLTKAESSISLEATSTSGLSISYTSKNQKTLINGSTATILGDVASGLEGITASQAGDDNYNAATDVTIEFCISPVAPAIHADFTDPSAPSMISDNEVDNHEWFIDGVSQGTGDQFTYSVSITGTYKVKALAEDGCPSSDFSNEIVLILTDIEQELKSKGLLYPNPIKDILHFRLDGDFKPDNLRINVIGLDGKIYYCFTEGDIVLTSDRQFDLNLAHLKTGLYLIQVENGLLRRQYKIRKD